MGGLQPSDLVILAGRPGMGKTALATNIAFNIAKAYEAERAPTARSRPRTAASSASSRSKCRPSSWRPASSPSSPASPSYKIRRGDITEDDFHRVADAVTEMQHDPLLHRPDRRHLDRPARPRGPGGSSARRGLDLLVIDYLQLLSGSKTRGDNRVQELTEITTGLKALAKELGIPILALSQLSRQVEQRDDKRPQLSDLRESGSIEQDADVVLFVFREEYYLKNKEPRPGTEEHIAWMAQMESAHGRAEVIIGKQRHGPTGTVELQFDAEVTRFSTLAREDTIRGNPLERRIGHNTCRNRRH